MSIRALSCLTFVLFLTSFGLYTYDSTRGRPKLQGVNLLHGLNQDKVIKIKITNTKKETITMEKSAGIFLLKERDNYPVSYLKINDLLYDLSSIKIAKQVSEKSDKSLRLTSKTKKLRISIFDKKGKLMTGLIIGKNNERSGTYVKRLVDGKVFLTEKTIMLFRDKDHFVNKTFFSLNTKKIKGVKKLSPDISQLLKVNGKWFTSKNEEVNEESAQSFVAKLATLNFTDFYSQGDGKASKLAFPVTMEIQADNRVTYQLNLGTNGRHAFAKVRAIYDDYSKVSLNGSQGKNAKLIQMDQKLRAQKHVARFNMLKSSWVYQISKEIFDQVHENFIQGKKKK